MSQFSKMEKLFALFTETASVLENELSITYLEALAETGENLFQQNILQDVSELVEKRLMKSYQSIRLGEFEQEDIRKAFQLAVLKGMKQSTQPNHLMTPDAVALFIGYLVTKLTAKQSGVSILDPAIGTANLVTAVLNHLPKDAHAFGVEIDETLLKLAYVNANLQQQPLELYMQDALQPILVDPVDVVLCDLPVGYYPDALNAANYSLRAESGHSYAHHLFIEQSLKYTKPGGYLIFLIPNFLFESEEADKLNAFLKEEAAVYGLLQLPTTMFKDEKFGKSIFILRKQGDGVPLPKEALIGEMPSFSDKKAMQSMIQQIDKWFENQF